jgi:hypothetical protein
MGFDKVTTLRLVRGLEEREYAPRAERVTAASTSSRSPKRAGPCWPPACRWWTSLPPPGLSAEGEELRSFCAC